MKNQFEPVIISRKLNPSKQPVRNEILQVKRGLKENKKWTHVQTIVKTTNLHE